MARCGFGAASGFFWRWEGSTNKPRRKEGFGKVVQTLSVIGRKARVLAEFRTAMEAARHMRMTQGNIKQLYQCCREQSVWKGYRWRYKPQANRRTDQNQERRYGQEVVGRRLKVWKGDTCCTPMQDSRGRDHIYCAAQVRAFDAAFGKHRVRYDGGEAEMLDLAPVKLNFSASTTEARLVEQVCVRSGKVLKTLSSVLAATQSGVAASRIASMLRGDNKAAGGFFWRYCGSKTAPAVPKNNGTVAVEQVCLETGKVLRSFSSVSGAGSHHNVSISSISATLNGRIGSCGGYFWRYKGSKTRPRPSKTTKAIEQLCRDRESHGKIQVDRRGGKGCRCDGSVYQ